MTLKFWLTTCIITLATAGFSQNAYYDAIKLVKWYNLRNTDKVKIETSDIILGKLLKYSDSKSKPLSDSTNTIFLKHIYKEADSIYSYSKRYTYSREQVINTVLNKEVQIPVLKAAKKTYQNYENSLDKLETQIKRYEKAVDAFKKNSDLAEEVNKELSSLKTIIIPVDGLHNEFMQFKNQMPIEDIPVIDSLVSLYTTEKLKYYNKQAEKAREEIYVKTMALSTNEIRNVIADMKLVSEELGKSEKDAKILIAKENLQQREKHNIVELSNPQALADLNFPSQSEIIDAIAIYLARRVKQEAALSFIENLNRVIKTDDLAQDLFPETWQIMQTEEAYTSPRFGVKWRNAIATDYISLPQNINNSKYIDQKIKDPVLKNYFNDAVLFGHYAARKYSFIDIVRTLFNEQHLLKGQWTKKGINILHVINQEFYDTSANRYWVSPDEFFDCNEEELLCMFDLLKIKYDQEKYPVLSDILEAGDKFRKNVSQLKNFCTELLTILQQFQVVQSAAFEKSSSGNVKDVFWDTQRTFIDFLLEQPLFPLDAKSKQGLNICRRGFYIYDYISNRNYAAAIENGIRIIEILMEQSPKMLINLNSEELSKLRDVSDKIKKINTDFTNLLQVRNLKECIAKEKSAGKLSSDTIETLKAVEYCSFSEEEKLEFYKILFESKPTIPIKDLLSNIKKFEDTIVKKLKPQYNELVRIINKRLDLHNGKLLYRNAEELRDDMLNAAQLFVKKENSNYFKWLIDFSGLLTEVANSKDSRVLANIIESYARPPGSYRHKRNCNFSLDLNAYVGLYAGLEQLQGQKSFKPVYGLTAPIGLAFSFGTSIKDYDKARDERKVFINNKGKLKRRTQHAFTVDISVIDIGAVVSYRLTQGEDKGLPQQVSWSQILAPGINLRWGIKNTPLCLGLGLQKTPELRTFNDSIKDAWRLQMSFAFDLPLINILYSKK